MGLACYFLYPVLQLITSPWYTVGINTSTANEREQCEEK
jgi:hypothetical protein